MTVKQWAATFAAMLAFAGGMGWERAIYFHTDPTTRIVTAGTPYEGAVMAAFLLCAELLVFGFLRLLVRKRWI